MKPTLTCHVSRKLHSLLGSTLRVDHEGRPLEDVPFPSMDLDASSFRKAYLAYSLNRKIELDDQKTADVAMASFLEAESACASTNLELVHRIGNASVFDKRVIIRATQLIAECIGDAPPDDFFGRCVFTGGASTSRPRSESHPALKWWASSPLHVTPLAYPLLLAFKKSLGDLSCIWDDPGLLSLNQGEGGRSFCKIVPGSRLDMVEKNYKTKRIILIEPDGNMLLQKGIGNCFRESLYNVGIDLSSQNYNQFLARVGSETGTLATVDGRMASDLISLSVPAVLFPPKWFDLIYRARSHVTEIEGRWVTLHKLSSMGNGFTFEVESLIFWALTQALIDVAAPRERRIAIFGDDVVCPSSVFSSLVRIYRIFGFQINTEKSFATGPFRESCGVHYYNGVEVSPVYIRKPLNNLEERFRIVNQMHAWENGSTSVGPLTKVLLETIPIDYRRQIPLQWENKSGLYDPALCSRRIRLKRGRNHRHSFTFSAYVPTLRSRHERWEDECKWFFQICTGFSTTRLKGFDVIEPARMDAPVEGEREWQMVKLPATVKDHDSISG